MQFFSIDFLNFNNLSRYFYILTDLMYIIIIIIIIIIIKNEKIRVTLCENAAGALYIVHVMEKYRPIM